MIGVFGGTFDPVHLGHLRIALDALEQLPLEQVRLIPLAQAVHRDQPGTPAALRLQMLKVATEGRSDLVADDREILRSGPSYTIDTLRSLRADFPDQGLCLLLGGDAFGAFDTWRDPQGILAIANIAVLQRPGHSPHTNPAVRQMSDDRQTERLVPGVTGQVVFCPVTQLEISSSDIRDRVRGGRSIDYLVPDRVRDMILERALYT